MEGEGSDDDERLPPHTISHKGEGCVSSLTCAAVAAAKARMEKSFMLETGVDFLCVHVGCGCDEHVVRI